MQQINKTWELGSTSPCVANASITNAEATSAGREECKWHAK